MYLSEQIEKALVEDKDFIVWKVRLHTYNDMWNRYKDSDRIKCICHNWIHKFLNEDATFHVIDNFLKKTSTQKYYEAPSTADIIPIDKFCSKGEHKDLSISLASIIARGRYLKNFYNLMKKLGAELDDDTNHKYPSTKIEPILKKLEEKWKSREYIFNTFCKRDMVEKYNSLIPN